jgi:hypothetical protein
MLYQTLHRTLKLDKQTHSKPRGWTNAKYFDIEWVIVDSKKSLKTQCILYQRVSQNPYIEEEQTTQWLKEKNTKGQTRI